MGERGGDGQPVPGKQGDRSGEGRRFPLRAVIRKDEVKGRCRTVLQSKAEGFLRESQPNHRCIVNAHPTLALV